MDEYYMKVSEVAERWRVSKMTIYRLIEDGTLPVIRVGRSFRIALSDVERMEQAR